MNSELRHKLAAVQTQLRAARDREGERELQRQGAVELAQEPAQDQARGAGYEQRQEPERATAEAGAPGTPEDPVSARRSIRRSGTWWALGKGLLCGVSRSTGKLEGGIQVCAPPSQPASALTLSQSTGLSSVAAPSPPKSPCQSLALAFLGWPRGGRGTPAEVPPSTKPVLQPGRPSKVGQCSFSREELEQILQERNELKANVFLLKEELAYFQR